MNWAIGLEHAWTAAIVFVPAFLAFVAVLFIGHFGARWLGKTTDKAARKVGVERMVERGGVRTTLERSGYSVSQILGKLVYYVGMLFVLQLAFSFFGPNPVSGLIERM